MDQQQLGSHGPQITTIGFGAWAIGGGDWSFGWGPQDDQESIAAIQKAIDLGINWIDTAAVYGLGHAETIVGQAIQGRRNAVLIATKCGRVWDAAGNIDGNLRPESMRRELDASLKRLGVGVIDLYQIHWPDPQVPVEESWGQMTRFVEDGKVRYIGVSNFDVTLLERCKTVRYVDALQPPYSMINRDIESEILPYCATNGIGVIAYSPMQSGLLSGSFELDRLAPNDWRRGNVFFQEPHLARNLAFVERVRPIAARYGKTVGQLAIAWVLQQSGVTAAIVGARRPDQVTQNVGGAGCAIEPADLEAIDAAFAETR